ncbi:putative transcription factor [Hibiscus syriacus]|uniref:Transcription factor n=1 Tax=Hibiscus syriacus TaxID=106335 RepID=A0A6A2ZUP1_HIBSY|nr:putative transcription factor [Hibiscus syriacus]
MRCFTVLRSNKKRSKQSVFIKRIAHKEHMPSVLPEPRIQTRSLQSSPPSFITRVKPIQPDNKGTSNRTRAVSAPSSLDSAEQDALASVEFEEQEELKSRGGLVKEQKSLSPQPLPLPCPSSTVLKTVGKFRTGNVGGPFFGSGPLHLPPSGTLRNFSYEEIAAACHHFSSDQCTSEGLPSAIYKASFGDDESSSKKFEATVTLLHPFTQGLREFINEVNTLASLQHPNLCKLLGYHAHDGSEERMLVYERLFGSLDQVLYGRADGPPLDWNTQMKIALCSAQGLIFLHEEGPFQIDKDFSAKLLGYGCVGHIPETEEMSSNSVVSYFEVFDL